MDGRDAGTALNASLLLDGEDRILEGNRDAEVFLERPLEEVRKMPLLKANPSLYSALKELLAKTRRGRGVEDYALAYKVGKRLMRLSISITPYPLEALGTTGTLVTITTLGARPVPERRERRKEKPAAPVKVKEIKNLPELLGSLPEAAFLLDLEANFTYANPAMCSLMGHAEEEITGRPLSFFMLKDEAKQALDSLVEAACSAPWRGELEFNRGDGTTSYMAVTVDLLRTGEGEADQLLGMGRDYTFEARMRREREEELKRVWVLLENVGVAVACFTPDYRVTLLSHSAEDLLGTTKDRAIGTPLPELFTRDRREEISSLLDRALNGEEVRGTEVSLEGAKGGKRTLVADVKPAVMAEGKPGEYMMVLREATRELSEMEKAGALVRESQTRMRFLELGMRSRNSGDYLDDCLGAMEEELACAAGVAYILKDWQALFKAGRGLDEGVMETLRSFKLRPGYARICGLMPKLLVEIHGGVPRKGWEEVHSFVEKADTLLPLFREKRWRGILILPLRGEEIAGALALADCDPEKLDLIDDQALSVMGETMASVLAALDEREAGEGKPPAGPGGPGRAPATAAPPGSEEGLEVIGRSRERFEGGGTRAPVEEEKEGEGHDLLEIAQEAKKIEPARNHLSIWGEQGSERPIPSPRGIDLPALLWELKDYFSRPERRGEIFLEIEEDLPRMHTDKRLLRESLRHLLDNAVRYSPPGAPVILGVERWGDEVLLRVEDQGPGIPPEVMEGVMRAGLENAGGENRGSQGRASGLSICHRYVTAMGGNLTVKGRPDEGTTAFIRLRVLPFIGEGL